MASLCILLAPNATGFSRTTTGAIPRLQDYDNVGNRLTRTSSLSGVTNQAFGYDPNDRVNGDQYDSNGNTKLAPVSQPTPLNPQQVLGIDDYDSENRLIQRFGATNGQPSTINLTYDGDGNRVREIVNGQVKTYLVDDRNPTGYAQVVEEIVNGSVNHTYTYGLDLISQDQFDPATNNWRASFYAYDGRGTVRFLTDETGAVTDTYTYDAFGTLITVTGSTNNRYLYSGEQFDPNLGLYYLRARLMNPLTGRFWTQDSYEGDNLEPAALHKYTYASVDPTNSNDPSGMVTLVEVEQSSEISAQQDKAQSTAGLRWFRRGLTNKAWTVFVGGYAVPRFHTFIYVEKIGSAGGLRYDIGLTRASQARFGRGGPVGQSFDIFDGLLTIQPALRAQVASETGGRLYPIAAFTTGQFAVWNALVVPLGYGVVDPFSKVDFPLPYAKAPYPFTFSCFKWTLEAAVAAFPIQILPF